MKPAYGLVFLFLLLQIGFAFGQKENVSVLDKKISLEAKNETISEILEKISLQSEVYFSYNASLIDAEKRRSIIILNKTIRETLNILFESKYTFNVLGEQVIITKAEIQQLKKKETEVAEMKPNVIVFHGKIIDRQDKEALPYASISVLGSTIGTISNSEGEFLLKLPEILSQDTILISCLGYRQFRQPVSEIDSAKVTIHLQSVAVQLKEIKVTVINPEEIISKIVSKIPLNYPRDPEVMTSFYREVLKQDSKYIDVAEALMEIRKSPYGNTLMQDKIKFIKGRKSLNVKPFQYVDFKIQGGPYYITKLDVVKTIDSFLDPEFRDFYKYTLDAIIELNDRDTYEIKFKPKDKVDYPCYQGTMYVDMSSFALVQAEFSLSRSGLKFAQESLIKKKPKDFYVRPVNVRYKVSYRRVNNNWHFNNAMASIDFRVKSKKDKINSTFHSISELQITESKPDDGTHYKRNDLFSPKDIFTEIITTYNENFWEDYNTIVPTEDLREAIRNYYLKNDSIFNKTPPILPNKTNDSL